MSIQQTYCVHMDAYVVAGSCAICEDRRERSSRYGDQRIRATARFNGRCEACDEPIDVGAEIVLGDENDGWIHYECAEEQL